MHHHLQRGERRAAASAALRRTGTPGADLVGTASEERSRLSFVGSSIRIGINGTAEIVGVLPPEFEMLLPPRTGFDSKVDLWTAMRLNYDTAARNTGALRVIGRLRAIPGVLSVASTSSVPLDGSTTNIPYAPVETGSSDPSAFKQAKTRVVTPGYFETLRTRVIAGRTFSDEDNLTDRASKVVIDDILAAQAYPGASPIGRTLLVRNLAQGPNAPQNVRMEIIGVVAHQRHESLASPGREGLYYVDAYYNFGAANRWVVRTSGQPSAVLPAVRAAVAEIDRRAIISEAQPMSVFVSRASGPTQFAATMIGLFGFVALVMAAVGLYGLLSTTVRLRTPELGMRMVCGADRAGILRLVFADGLRLSVAGLVIGVGAALLLTQALRSLLVAVTPTDPLTFAAIGALFVIIPLRRRR